MGEVDIIAGATDAAIADWLAERLAGAFALSDRPVAMAVPGGTTPFPILERLLRHDLPWRRLTVWPTDDRAVPEDHPASNTGRLRAQFDPVGAEVVTLSEMEAVPGFALAWLGMGADGHVASLFPSANPSAQLQEAVVRITPDPLPPEAPFARISLTIPALLASAHLVFVIRGADKRAVFDAALTGESDLPISRLLAAATQPVTCFT